MFARTNIVEKKNIAWNFPSDLSEGNLQCFERKRWVNKGGNQEVYPLKLFKPTCLEHLIYIIQSAEKDGCRIKAVGSRHAWSDVAMSTDYMIDTHGLNAILPIEKEMDVIDSQKLANILDDDQEETIFQVEGGIKIRDLNNALFERNLALLNMGGFDEQTIVGAASTSTHGTGVTLAPLCDVILSLTLVTTCGEIYRIEPTNGITHREQFISQYPHIHLIKNDEIFHSVGVSLGTMGIIYSVIIKVRKSYYLNENRIMTTWDEVKKKLRENVMNNYRHYDLIVNPYEINGQRNVIVTTKHICDPPGAFAGYFKTHRGFVSDFLGMFPTLATFSGWLARKFLDMFPKATPSTIRAGLRLLVHKEFKDRSYKVLNLGAANYIRGCSAELAIPVDKEHKYLDSVEEIFRVAAHSVEFGNQYLTSPIALRYVKASKHYLSMMHELPNGPGIRSGEKVETFCLIELPIMSFSIGGLEIHERIEKCMYTFNARPHWGQVNFISGSHININELYTKLDDWKQVFYYFNSKFTFSNEFTYRCGFDHQIQSHKPSIDAHALMAIEKAKNSAFLGAYIHPLHDIYLESAKPESGWSPIHKDPKTMP